MRLALIVVNIEYEFSHNIIDGARKFCYENGHDLFIFPARSPNWQQAGYGYHEWAITKFINSNNIDGLIIPSATQTRFISVEDYYKILDDFKKEVPVVSMITQVPGIPSVIVDVRPAFEKLVRHLINEHKKKRFAFLNIYGNNDDVKLRYDIFRNVLKDEGIEFDERLNLKGSFTYSSAVIALSDYKTKESIDFDTIICVTDEMALGATGYLQSIGVKVPEDVIVTGFDDIIRSSFNNPSLTTINQKVFEQSYTAASLLTDVCNGRRVEDCTTIEAGCMFRQSCGCVNHESPVSLAIDENGNSIIRDMSRLAGSGFVSTQDYLIQLLEFVDGQKSGLSLKKMSNELDDYFDRFGIHNVAICLFEEPLYARREDKRYIPDKARLYYAICKDEGISFKDDQNYFDCSRELLPDFLKNHFKGTYCCMILYQAENIYGYIVMQLDKHEYSFYRLIYSFVSKFIVTAWEVTQQELENFELTRRNNSLSILSKTDELTGILNRRGFMVSAQQVLNLAVDIGKKGMVIYCDIDGLKYINDTFGHDAGDRAIIKEVDILKHAFRAADTFGRLGGDEFAILSISLDMSVFERLKKRVDELCEEWNSKNLEPFKLSISLGAVEFSVFHYDLVELLKEADENQYKEKRRKKDLHPGIPGSAR